MDSAMECFALHLEQVNYFQIPLMGFKPNPHLLPSPQEANGGIMSGFMVMLSKREEKIR